MQRPAMNCPQCGHSNPVDLVECERCGDLLVDVFEPTSKISLSFDRPPEATANASSSGELSPGSLLGDRYEILELLGEGGMGRVFKVHDKELDRVVALKLIRTDQANDPLALQRFKQELLLARQITHKNVVRIFDLSEANGFKFFTMEWIDGENLKATIRRKGKTEADDAVRLIRPMLEALQEAHSQGVVHRDLKPHNVMIDRDGEPHIMDFGIARTTDSNTMTATNAVMGTPDYMSPEQACGEKAGPQSDLYSLGVILYEMLTGELPFQAESPLSRVVLRLTRKPAAPRELNGALPAYLERIVLKCMEVDRNLRYQSADEVLRDLERGQVDRSLGLRFRLAAARHTKLLAAVATLIVVGVIGAYLFTKGSPSNPPPEEPVTTLAILPFKHAAGSGGLEWMRNGLPEMLFTDISQSRYVRPVPMERIDKLLRELGVDGQSRFHEATLESVSELAPAQSVLYGQFVESEGRVRMDLTLRKAESGVPVHFKVEEKSDQIFSLVDQITRTIKQQLDLTPEQLKGDTDRPIAEVSTASLDALRSYQEGLAHMRRGANQSAIPLLTEATEADPGFAMALAKLAEAYLNAGEYRQAEQVIEKAQKVSESAPLPLAERYHIHAIAARVTDDLETTAESYRELATLYPGDPDIQLSLAQSLEKLGQLAEASGAYERVLALAPANAAALLGLGRAQVLSGQPAKAVQSLEKVVETKDLENDMEAMGMLHSVLGVAYRDTGQLDEAIEHLKLSLDFRQKAGDRRGQSVTLTNLAAVYEHRGEIDKALEAEHEAVSLARQIGDRHAESLGLLNLGLTYKAAGELDRALEAFRESMRIEMDRQDYVNLPTRLDYIADIYRIRGQYDDALVYLEQAKGYLAKSGRKHEKATNLNITGLVKKAQGQYEEAIDAFLAALPVYQAIQAPMGVASVQLSLAEIYSDQGRYADAHRALQQSLGINQEMGTGHAQTEVRAQLAHFYIEVGQLDKAKEEIDRAQQLVKESRAEDLTALIQLAQGELLRIRGDMEKAAAVLSSAEHQSTQKAGKELSLRCLIALGHVYLETGQLEKAEQALRETSEEAARAGLRSIETRAGTYLARVYLVQGRTEEAYDTALEMLEIAKGFSGRPLIFKASAVLGDACERSDRQDEFVEHYSRVAATLEWIKANLGDEHLESYMTQREVDAVLEKAYKVMKQAGREREVASLPPLVFRPKKQRAGVVPARSSYLVENA